MSVTIDTTPVPRGIDVDPNAPCELCLAGGIVERATTVLSVPSQGLQQSLCQMHQQARVLDLERALIGPFHVTGLDAAPTVEEAAQINLELMRDKLEDAADLNAHLQRRLSNQSSDLIERHLEQLDVAERAKVEAFRERDAALAELAALKSERQSQ
jgi:hypothetical protein